MVAIPEFREPDAETREAVMEWYETHKMTYARVWSRLDEMRDRWGLLSLAEREALLKGSYVFTIFSQRVPLHEHEEAWRRLLAGESVREALTNSGAGLENQKEDWIHTSLADGAWAEVVDLLEAGKADAAHKRLIDETLGLRATKGGFVLANLGFTQKMCLNGNVSSLLGAESSPETVDIGAFEELCAEVQSFFPELAEILEPYHLQWLLFDYYRINRFRPAVVDSQIATHDAWFNVALGDTQALVARMQALTATARASLTEEDLDSAIETALEQEDAAIRQQIEADLEEAIADGGSRSRQPQSGGSVEWMGMTLPEEVGVWRLQPGGDDQAMWEYDGADGDVLVNVSESNEEPGTYQATVVNFDALEREALSGERVALDGAVGAAISFMGNHPDGYDPAAGGD